MGPGTAEGDASQDKESPEEFPHDSGIPRLAAVETLHGTRQGPILAPQSESAARAAARQAMGTRYGEQLT